MNSPERPTYAQLAPLSSLGDNAAALDYRELSGAAADVRLLRRFYDGLYAASFPDENEREAFDNIVMYLRGAVRGHCDFRVLLVLDADQIVGGSISDYFVASNTAVVEFITIADTHRSVGHARHLLATTEDRLRASASIRGRQLACIFAEIDDPFRPTGAFDSMDPFARIRWWARRGYSRLELPYVQPPLSETQAAVTNLMLCVKAGEESDNAQVPASRVDAFLRDYLMYAMRIARPESSAEYRRMADWLAEREAVHTAPLDVYAGHDRGCPLDIEETDLASLLEACSAHALAPASGTPRAAAVTPQHAWMVRHAETRALAGVVAFRVLGRIGVASLFAARPAALPSLVARVERQMLLESETVQGWFMETRPDSIPNGFSDSGVARDDGYMLAYKELGARYEPAALEPTDVQAACRALGIDRV
jgi:hypothetical protein